MRYNLRSAKKLFVNRYALFTILTTFCIFLLLQTAFKYTSFKECSVNNSRIAIDTCKCKRDPRILDSPNVYSTCDYYSACRGPNQNVVSYTFFGKTSSFYFPGVELSIMGTAKKYPGWIMRLYHNINMDDKHESDQLCKLWCRYQHLDLCDITKLPPPLCDQSSSHGEIWRFFVLGDPLVETFLVRDIDAPILDREIAAVSEWLKSNKTWHIMRDHPWHTWEILAGMWGGQNRNLNQTEKLRNEFILKGANSVFFKTVGVDQPLLRDVLWPIAINDSLIHDSYTCKMFPHSRPFPTQLEGNTSWVGHSYAWRRQYPISTKCPVECRPKDHMDWEYC